jgi:DNA-directed RNA polymerase specialized sigma24 family protein
MEVQVPVKKKKKGVQYFTQETEDAIVLYNKTLDSEVRSRLYNDKIHYAFFKLTENIIHTFKFYYTEVDNIEDLQHEVITFLLSKIHLFNQDKGAKAYSYFGTIAKRYLILSNQKNYKKRIDTAPVEILEEDETHSYSIDDSSYDEKLSHFIDEYTSFCTKNIFELFPKEYDAQIADAILELFRKRENLDVFNKKALYIYIREQVDVKTPKITKIANQLYDIFREKYIFYLEHGYTNF